MYDYVILGILQGIFEWVPISSEGIVVLVSQFLSIGTNPVDMALFLHLGTLFAVLVYFRKDWKDLLQMKNPKLLRFLAVATIASLLIGYPLYMIVRNVAIGASVLLVMGLGLLVTAYFHKVKKSGFLEGRTLALVAGILQGIAVVPGLSRSGATIFGLSLGKLSPSEVLKISYMMSVPAILVSSIYVLVKNPVLIEGWPSLISSFIVGILSLSFLIRLSERINFFWFALIFALLCFCGGIFAFFV